MLVAQAHLSLSALVPVRLATRDGMKKFYGKAVGLSLGLNPTRNRFGWLCRLEMLDGLNPKP